MKFFLAWVLVIDYWNWKPFASGVGGVSIQIYRESSGWKMRQIHPWNLGLDAVAKTYNFANETSSSGVLERIGVYSTKDSPFGWAMQ